MNFFSSYPLPPSAYPLRRGVTLVELLLFIALFGAVAAIAIPIFFTSAESRVRQQTMALVEQNGAQILQVLARRVRSAERILLPVRGKADVILALQTGSGSTNPTIIAVQTGSIVLVERERRQTLSSSQISIQNFRVQNTSSSDSRPSVMVSFTVSRTIRLQAPLMYQRLFEVTYTLLPDDIVTGGSCACNLPTCAAGVFQWQICTAGVCSTASGALMC